MRGLVGRNLDVLDVRALEDDGAVHLIARGDLRASRAATLRAERLHCAGSRGGGKVSTARIGAKSAESSRKIRGSGAREAHLA